MLLEKRHEENVEKNYLCILTCFIIGCRLAGECIV